MWNSKSQKEIESKIGYKFKDSELLKRAFTHSSFGSNNYEKLEFLGDSILDFIISLILFKKNANEGRMSVVRTRIVGTNNLANAIDSMDLVKYLIQGNSYKDVISNAIKADMCEAIIAAIYIDSNQDLIKVENFILNHIKCDYEFCLDYKTRLQEYVQGLGLDKVFYVTDLASGDFESQFTCNLYYKSNLISTANGRTKKIAEQNAAEIALNILKGEWYDF